MLLLDLFFRPLMKIRTIYLKLIPAKLHRKAKLLIYLRSFRQFYRKSFNNVQQL